MAHILKLKQIREGDIIDSFGGVVVTKVEPGVQHLVDGPNDGVRLTFDREIGPGRNSTTMGQDETLLVRNPGNRRPPAYEPPPPPKEGDQVQQWCPLCQREVKMRLGGKLPNHNSNKPGKGTKGYRCEASGKTVEEAKVLKAEQERKYRLLGYASVGATASVSRTGTPSPNIDVTWTEHDSWREGDPPKDPNYADRYFTFRIAHQGSSGPPVPEPINVIEAMIHDHTAFGRPEFRWEVDGTSQWGDDFGAHGTTTDLDAAKAQAAAAVQRASDEFWAKYDDSETPKGPPGGFPWDHRASKTAAASDDLAFEQDEVEASYLNARIDGVVVARIDTRSFDIRWIDGMDSRGAKTLAAAKATVKERIDRPSYRRLLTEAPVGTAWPKTASVIDYSVCPDCGNRLQWGDSEIHSLKPGVYGSPEDYAICIHCGITWTEETLEEAMGTTAAKTALNEQKAPPEVDTLRDEQCPVCGEVDAYSGDDCPVCGYVKPPNAFTDPDTAKAKEMDLRKDQADETKLPGDPATEDPAAGGAGQGLERFRVDGPAPAAAGASGSGLERFRVGGLNPNWAKGLPDCPDCHGNYWRALGENGTLIVCRMCDRRWRPEVLKQEAAAKKRDPYAEGQRAGRGKNPHWTYWNPWPKGTPEADLYTKGWEQASGQKWAVVTYEAIEDDPGDLMERIAAVGAHWPVIEIPGMVDVEIKAG